MYERGTNDIFFAEEGTESTLLGEFNCLGWFTRTFIVNVDYTNTVEI